jgi:hypothetical protein
MPKCCAYGYPNDPEGEVIRFTLCVPDDEPCPKFMAYLNVGEWRVIECGDCKPPEPWWPPRRLLPEIYSIEETLEFIRRVPAIVERLLELGLIPKAPDKPKDEE